MASKMAGHLQLRTNFGQLQFPSFSGAGCTVIKICQSAIYQMNAAPVLGWAASGGKIGQSHDHSKNMKEMTGYQRVIASVGVVSLGVTFMGYFWVASLRPRPSAPAVAAPKAAGQRVARSAELLAELKTLRQGAASELLALAPAHEALTREKLAGVLQDQIQAARGRVDGYADWLLSYKATWPLGKAWYDGRLGPEMVRLSEEKLLSSQQMTESLGAETERLQVSLAEQTAAISSKYQDRVVSILAHFDEASVANPLELGRAIVAPIQAPALVANASGISSFVGSTFAGSFAEKKFVTWLAKKIALKAGSKVLRVGTGPVGWVVGLSIGWAGERAADNYLFKPQLASNLNAQLTECERQLLAANGPVAQIAAAQGQIIRSAAADLAKPVECLFASTVPVQH